MQKETYFFGVPWVTLRPETEWVETVQAGWNVLVGSKKKMIVDSVVCFQIPGARPEERPQEPGQNIAPCPGN